MSANALLLGVDAAAAGGSGQSTYSVSLDGSNDYVDIASINLAGGYTVSAWFKISSLAANFNTIAGCEASNGNAYTFELDIRATGEITLFAQMGGGHSQWDTSGLGIVTNTWYHVASSWTASAIPRST
jgi:hypothetical protein